MAQEDIKKVVQDAAAVAEQRTSLYHQNVEAFGELSFTGYKNVKGSRNLESKLKDIKLYAGEMCVRTMELVYTQELENLSPEEQKSENLDKPEVQKKLFEQLAVTSDVFKDFVNMAENLLPENVHDALLKGYRNTEMAKNGQNLGVDVLPLNYFGMFGNIKEGIYLGIKCARDGNGSEISKKLNVQKQITKSNEMIERVVNAICTKYPKTERGEIQSIITDLVDAHAVESLMRGISEEGSTERESAALSVMKQMLTVPNHILANAQVKLEQWREKMAAKGDNISKEDLDGIEIGKSDGKSIYLNDGLSCARDNITAGLIVANDNVLGYIDPNELDPALQSSVAKQKKTVDARIANAVNPPKTEDKVKDEKLAKHVAHKASLEGRTEFKNKGAPLRGLFKLYRMFRGIVKKLLSPITGGGFGMRWMASCGIEWDDPEKEETKDTKKSKVGKPAGIKSEEVEEMSDQVRQEVTSIMQNLEVTEEQALAIFNKAQNDNISYYQAAAELNIPPAEDTMGL